MGVVMSKKKHRKECIRFVLADVMDNYDQVPASERRKWFTGLLKRNLAGQSLCKLEKLVKIHTPSPRQDVMQIFEALTALKSVRSMVRQLILFEEDPVTGTVKMLHREILKACEGVVGKGE